MDEEAKIIRARKERVYDHLNTALREIKEILWIHPNEAPVYLDFDQTRDLREIIRVAKGILDRHDKTEEQLRAEDRARRVA